MSEDTRRVPVLKARVIGGEGGGVKGILSRSLDVDDRTWQQTGAITPPYDPETLCKLLEHSNSLRQNVDAYATNIDGYGHRFEPVIDLEADDIDDQIRAAIMEHRAHQQQQSEDSKTISLVPTDEELEARKAQLAEEMAKEKVRLERFFRFCCADESFISLRRRTRQDIEIIGYGFWEVLRNPLGEIVELVGLPAFTMRLRKLEDPFEIEERIQTSELSYDTRTAHRRFRTYVQKHENQTVYFKEFGDPRTLSAKTGTMYESVAEMKAEEDKDAIPASEVIYFQISSPRTSYGIPRWIGVLLAVLGSRESEEVNYAYFENKSIPPLMLMVAGGRLSEDTVTRLEDAIENDVKGKSNFHKMLILEGEPYTSGQAENAGRMRIDLKPLTGSQNQDSLFIKYDERNIDKVGGAFRLPRLLRGDVRDFNRATADASLRFAEQQVFQPEREDFDWLINRKLLSAMGICFWRFVSNGPVQRDPHAVVEDTRGLVKDAILTPAEGREQLGEVLRRELKEIDADWTKQPIQLTLAGIPVEGEEPEMAPVVAEPAEPEAVEEEKPAEVGAPEERAAAVEFTATTIGQVLTVNEARSALGFGPLTLADGSQDPDGNLTIEAFAAKRGNTEKAFRDGIDKALSQIELAQELREIG